MNRILFFSISVLFISIKASAQNPIVPPGVYIADPEAKVFRDGRLYIYGSRDESDDYWCSYTHHVLSTNDMLRWKMDEDIFSSKGENDAVKASDGLLFAPDCMEHNGKYYLYYCTPEKAHSEGVAVSDNPVGPFVNGKQIKGTYQIDPAAFVDKDGQGYFYWGQGEPKVAKLSKDLLSIDTTTIVKPLKQEGKKVFHEGSSIRRIGDWYYLVFADESRNKRPTCLGYAMSKSPMGPFIYKGVIIDNNGCDPAVWNNHGSIQQYKGQWYVFYHRATNNSRKFRKACIEPITIEKDGTIKEVEMTSQGAGAPLSAFEPIDAARACLMNGNVRISKLPTTDIPNEGLTKIKNDDWAAFKYIDFKHGAGTFQVKTIGAGEGVIEVVLDDLKGTVIGTCKISSAETQAAFNMSETKIKTVKGVHAVYLRFKSTSGAMPDVDWFSFGK